MYFYINLEGRHTPSMCALYKNPATSHFSISPFPHFLSCYVSHLLSLRSLACPMKLRAFMSLTQALCAVKATPCNKCSLSPTWPQKRVCSPLIALLVCALEAKQNLAQVLQKALTALQAGLQEDDSSGGGV